MQVENLSPANREHLMKEITFFDGYCPPGFEPNTRNQISSIPSGTYQIVGVCGGPFNEILVAITKDKFTYLINDRELDWTQNPPVIC